ncbi:MAG: hypothetical protein D6714_02005 [Bacteroidetes bacterium]|nr:MAG: hypothetical protein D6714_02005 [Bacteroidota bacterium]
METSWSSLKKSLRRLSKDWVYSLVGDEAYGVIGWNAGKKGPFTLTGWLTKRRALRTRPTEDFAEAAEQSVATTTALKNYLSEKDGAELTIRTFGFPKLPVRLRSGQFFGKSGPPGLGVPLFTFAHPDGGRFGAVLRQNRRPDSSAVALSDDLRDAGLPGSEVAFWEALDYRFSDDEWTVSGGWWLDFAEDEDTLVERLLTGAGYLKKQSLSAFLNLDNLPEDAEEWTLARFFEANLTDTEVVTLRYFCAGESWFVHYLMGQTPSGDMLGLQTVSFTF